MMLNREQRRRAFRAALLLSDAESVPRWAAERGYSAHHIHSVLNGRRPSARVQVLMDAFAIETILSFADELRASIDAADKSANARPAEAA